MSVPIVPHLWQHLELLVAFILAIPVDSQWKLNVVLMETESEQGRGRERERETQNPKQAPGSELSVQSDAGLELISHEIMT